mgnify:CR=1 FL=1
MENTYTYTARSIEEPEKVVTFTLHDDRMSVDIGTPVEQITRTLVDLKEDVEEEEKEEEREPEKHAKVWLKPLAVSLVEHGTGALHITDVDAHVDEDYLSLRSWIRLNGLRLLPITLMAGRIDNPAAAAAFVAEVNMRKKELASGLPFLNVLNYWVTWLGAAISMMALFLFWQRHTSASEPVT